MIIIELRNLKTQFSKQIIHQDLCLRVERGEILTIVGGSGSGKSVLLKVLIGLVRPQSGELIYYTDPPYPSFQIGVLFQSGALISSLTVAQNVMIPLLEVAKLPEKLAFDVALMKLKAVGLEYEDALKLPAAISGGMVKRVGLARALALDPEIVFLDEPTAGLDPISAAQFDELIQHLQTSFKLTVVMVTHDLDTLVSVSDRVGVLVDKKLEIGTVKEIANLNHPWVRQYFHGERGERFNVGGYYGK